jgi:hypothetical protein
VRERRGHRHVGGQLGAPIGEAPNNQRHWITAIAALGVIVSAYATYSASQAQAAANDFNRKVAKNNALAARQSAEVEVENRKTHFAHVLAAQRAGIGASGVQASEGSPLLVQMDSAAEAALDLARVRYQGEIGSRNYQSEAQLQKFAAQSARVQSYVGTGASLLGGAVKTYGVYNRGGGGGDFSATQGADYQAYRRGERG